jgi:hypothetical protein
MSNFKFHSKINFPGDLNTCKGQKQEFLDRNMIEECVASESMDYSLKPTGHQTYRQFNIHKFYILPTQCIYVLCGSENKQPLFSYTALTDWFVYPRERVFTALLTI